MNRRNLAAVGVALIGGIWAAVYGALKVAGRFEQTPDRIAAFIDRHPLDDLAPEDRLAVVEDVADRVNRLEPDQRRAFRASQEALGRDAFFERLDPAEKIAFIELTVDNSFREMIRAFNDMDADERRRRVEQALRDMEADGSGGGGAREELEALDPELFNRVVASGLEAYYREASADTKLDLAPLLERMQERIRMGR